MSNPKDRANDPNRKSAPQPPMKWEWDTRDGQSFDADGKRRDVPSRSWSMPDGKP